MGPMNTLSVVINGLPLYLALFFHLLLLIPSPAAGFKLTPYTGAQCRGASHTSWVGGNGQGCNKAIDAGIAESVAIVSTGAVDDNAYVVFFNSDDCDPDSEVPDGHKDGTTCFTGWYGSYAVWDLGSPPLDPAQDALEKATAAAGQLIGIGQAAAAVAGAKPPG